MTLTTISIIIAAVVYVAYNVISLGFFDVPESLSNTYYLYDKKCGKGWLFCLMMFTVVLFMMPAWIGMSEGSNFQFLAFLAPASIMFVGAAPRFKDSSLENKVHSISAIIAAICSLAWVAIVTPFWWFILICLGLVVLAAVFTSSYKTAYVYWLETVAFLSTFASAIVYSI